MALKKIGKQDWLGVNRGGVGYFVKYCPCCKEKIYLEGKDELEEFLGAVYSPRLWEIVKRYFKLRVMIPKIHFKIEFSNPKEREVVELNNRIAFSQNKKLVKKNPKEFSRSFFDKKYSAVGGVKELESMIAQKYSPSEIGKYFGFSRQRAFNILESYKFKKVA